MKKKLTKDFIKNKDRIRTPNAFQRSSGYDATPFMRGEVQMGKCVGKDLFLALLKNEASIRNITLDQGIGITKLKALIMENEKEQRKNDSSWDEKFFKPLLGVKPFQEALSKVESKQKND